MPSIVLQPDRRIGSEEDEEDDDDEVEVEVEVEVVDWSRLKYKDDGSFKINHPFRYLLVNHCIHVSLSTAEEHAML